MTPRVLLVEDDNNIREIYALKFEIEGFPVATAEHGQAALDQLAAFHPDIILLDLMMPVMDGLEFLQALPAHVQPHEYPAIIVFSNISEPGEIDAAMKLGVGAYWVKSDYTPERVTQELRQWWQSRS
jgi:CheY-like chemotaxis protein